MIHELKILPAYFDAVYDGRKKFEVRFNDRGYQVGDTLILREYEKGHYTGRSVEKKITYVLENSFGMEPHYCILSID
jgi:ASC-1-like (ASCH) protein